jgi:hypothetical protein
MKSGRFIGVKPGETNMALYPTKRVATLLAVFSAVAVWTSPSRSDYYSPPQSPTIYGGRLVSVDNNNINFDMSCKGNVRTFAFKLLAGIAFNDKCRGLRIDAMGDDNLDGCPDNWDHSKDWLYVKKFFLLETADRAYALKSVNFSGESFDGVLLISSKTISLPRASLQFLNLVSDCRWRKKDVIN